MTKSIRTTRGLTLCEKIIPWFDRREFLFSTLMFVIGLVLVIFYITKAKVRSEADLLIVNGHLVQYSFQEKQGGRGTLYLYYIWLNEYSNAFQIKADFVDYFNHKGFESRMRKNQMVHLSIPKGLATQLNNPSKDILVMSVDSENENFLNKERTISYEKMNYELWGAAVAIGLGLAWVGFRMNMKLTAANSGLPKVGRQW